MNRPLVTRILLIGGVVGPLLFIVAFLIEGATRTGYSAWRNFVSQLSTGDQGWVQIANFIVCGVLVLGFALVLRPTLGPGEGMTLGPALLAVFGLGLLIAGIFVTDPALGYPPGTPIIRTVHGGIHGIAGLVCFSSLAAACFVLARRFRGDPAWKGWATYSIITGVLVAASFVLGIVTSVLDERGIWPNAPTGIVQRIGIIAGWVWIALLALQLLRKQNQEPVTQG